MKASIRPATREDILQVHPRVPCRMRALAVEGDGKLLGVGGLLFQPDGLVVAFVAYVEGVKGQNVAVTLHKAGLKTMQMARDLGLRRVVASAELSIPAAERWLVRLGFEPFDGAWIWKGD